MEQIIIVPNELSQAECIQLIHDANIDNTVAEDPAFNYGDYNNLERRRMLEHGIVKRLAQKYKWNVVNAPLVFYPPGTGNEIHCDNSIVSNGEIVKITEWTHSVIIFLNDNFNGGHLVYPKQGIDIKPTVGTMVVAPAGSEFPHEVTKVDANRYVLVMRLI